mgnify:CR=1 FL=1|jgi:predicted nuclease of predicted toxin-antitoxin system
MKFVADESVDRQIVEQLSQSFEVYDISILNRGVKDEVVLNIASKNKAILITADKDFGELVFRKQKASAGIVLIRLSGVDANKKAQLVNEVIQEHQDELIHKFVVIGKNAVRIRSSIT